MKKLLAVWLLLAILFVGAACADGSGQKAEILVENGVILTEDLLIEYGEYYYSPEEVSVYLYVFCELPENYITKDEAYDMGWTKADGQLWQLMEGACIGGDRFGNREGLLPEAKGRVWYECDVNYDGVERNAERICFSNDGLIYYTNDHYESFTCLFEGWYLTEDGEIYGEVWQDEMYD